MAGQRLKIKDDLHYKRGGESASCSGCNNYVGRFRRHVIGGEFIGEEPRCLVMGLKHSIKYRINPNNICDLWDHSVGLLRLVGEAKYLELFGERRLKEAQQATAARLEFDLSRAEVAQ